MKSANDTSLGTYDYVIVGGGTAGCLLANRLSADPAISVLLLEAGGRDDYLWIHIPVGYLYCMNNPRTDWCFKTEVEPGLGGRAINYARGKVLGGRSSTPCATPPWPSAFPASAISTAATIWASAISRSTSGAACASMRPRPSCARRAGGPICESSCAPTPSACCWKTAAPSARR